MKNINVVNASKGFMPGRTVRSSRLRPGVRAAMLGGLFVGMGLAQANPTGGTVAAGSATISGTGTPSVTINQLSNTAIINWNSFSIGSGELTTFVQPSAASAVLNRVTGGQTSIIDGTLAANGQVYLVNGNGIVVGPGGVVNASAFTASTLDISNANFQKNKLQFTGASTASVQNLGTIGASAGDLFLIGQSVDNEGSLNAPNGTVGLAAAQSVLITQTGAQHVFVSATPHEKVAAGKVGVTNNGTISAMAAELRAANGNMYALAINNGGTIRATTLQQQGGHVYLTSDGGTIQNTGTIDASSTAGGATGGAIQLKTSNTGTVVNHGSVVSHGGQGGTGGTVDLSGGNLVFNGGVDLTTPGGTPGSLLLDPQSITVVNDPNANGVVTTTGTVTTYQPAPNFVGSTLDAGTLEAQLAIANVIINGVNNVTIDAPVTWGDTTASTPGNETASSLTLETTGKGGTININAAITGLETQLPGAMDVSTRPKASLIINDTGNGYVTTSVNGDIDVDNFILQAGIWQQLLTNTAPTPAQLKAKPGLLNTGTLPGFIVNNDFQLDGTSTFERFAGGTGAKPTRLNPAGDPYQIVDIYGLQGIGSPSDTLLGNSYILDNNINFDGTNVTGNTINWNGGDGTDGGAGWVPIGEGGKTVKPFTGIFDGNHFTVAGFYYYRPNDDLTGMFGEVAGTVENLSVDDVNANGIIITSILVGRLNSGGLINNCFTTFNALPEPAFPVNPSLGTTDNQSELPLGSEGVSQCAGGLVGEVLRGATVENSESTVGYELLGSSGVFGLTGVGGLTGINYGTITNCYSEVAGTTSNSVQDNGNIKNPTALQESINIGGLVGINFGTINGGACSGDISPTGFGGGNAASIVSGIGNINVGGFVGLNYGTIDTTVRVGGIHGTTVPYQAFSIDNIDIPDGADIFGGSGSYYIGGFVGLNYGKISNAYCAPSIGNLTDPMGVAFDAGGGGAITIENNLQPPGNGGNGALGDIAVGGFAGGNFGTITHSASEDSVASAANILGVGDITVKNQQVPEPALFNQPLSMDSIFVGGFVGLNGPRSTINTSFSDDNAALDIQLTLDPTQMVPTLAAPGDVFTLEGPGAGSDLVAVTGSITGGTGYYITGGFAGGNYGAISTSYSTGNVNVSGTTSQSNSFYTGGFAGISSGVISNVFETGDAMSVTTNAGSPNNQTGVVGGLIGQLNAGTVSYAYELGAVTGGTTREGLVGVRAAGAFTRSFWDTDTNPNLPVDSQNPGALGVTTLDLTINSTTEPTSVFHTALWNFKTIWFAPAPGNDSTPTLVGVPGP